MSQQLVKITRLTRISWFGQSSEARPYHCDDYPYKLMLEYSDVVSLWLRENHCRQSCYNFNQKDLLESAPQTSLYTNKWSSDPVEVTCIIPEKKEAHV